MKFNKMFIPIDAISLHKDFDIYYEDGTLALSLKGAWSSEKDKIAILGRTGGEIGHIKPDFQCLAYYLRLDRYEYVFHTFHIFKHYGVEGMLWEIDGTLSNPPLRFINEGSNKADVTVRLANLKDIGACFEVKATDVARLRIACATVISMLIKEHYRGKSEGLKQPNPSGLDRIKQLLFTNKGISYEELLQQEEIGK